MADRRFFQALGPLTLAQIAEATGARLLDPSAKDRMIAAAAPLRSAGVDGVSFLSDNRHAAALAETKAGAVFVAEAVADKAPAGVAVLVTDFPQAAWAMAASLLHRPHIHDGADGLVHPSAKIEADVVLGPGVMVGPGAAIGAGTVIASAAVIGPGVAIGRDCRIGAYASVHFALIGDRVSILAGARIGEAGFGVAPSPKGAVDVPQLGRVILQDGVTIGANSCVDRGSYDDTVIGENTKLDNLCHVAHGVRMGRNCAAAAYVGIAGSTVVGDGVQFGGRAGVRDHVTIGDRAAIAAGAAVLHDVPAGEVWAGYPAKPIRQWKREEALLAQLTKERGGDA